MVILSDKLPLELIKRRVEITPLHSLSTVRKALSGGFLSCCERKNINTISKILKVNAFPEEGQIEIGTDGLLKFGGRLFDGMIIAHYAKGNWRFFLAQWACN